MLFFQFFLEIQRHDFIAHEIHTLSCIHLLYSCEQISEFEKHQTMISMTTDLGLEYGTIKGWYTSVFN